MNNLLWVYSQELKQSKIIKKFCDLNIDILKSKNENNMNIYLITEKDYIKLKKYCAYKFRLYENAGIKKIKEYIYKKQIFILGVIFGLLFLFFLSFVIVDVQVIHTKENIRELLYEELENHGIKRLSLKKDFDKLSYIKKQILNDNKDKIEWLEIESKGMKYIIKVEERVIVPEKNKFNYCNVLAKKDGQILSFQIKNGVANVSNGSFVRKNDILISGDILLNEKSVEQICADGNIYAEVWYNINVEMPLYYENINKTGKSRINFMVEHNNEQIIILKSRLNDKLVSNKKIISVLGYNFYLQKEEEIAKKRLKYNEKDAYEEAIKVGLNKLNISLDKDAEIITQKVLKKNIKDSKIYLELFISVKEDIGIIQKIN